MTGTGPSCLDAARQAHTARRKDGCSVRRKPACRKPVAGKFAAKIGIVGFTAGRRLAGYPRYPRNETICHVQGQAGNDRVGDQIAVAVKGFHRHIGAKPFQMDGKLGIVRTVGTRQQETGRCRLCRERQEIELLHIGSDFRLHLQRCDGHAVPYPLIVRQSQIGIDHARPDGKLAYVKSPGNNRREQSQCLDTFDLRRCFGGNGGSKALADDHDTAGPGQRAGLRRRLDECVPPDLKPLRKVDIVASVARAGPVEAERTYAACGEFIGDDAPEFPSRAKIFQPQGLANRTTVSRGWPRGCW